MIKPGTIFLAWLETQERIKERQGMWEELSQRGWWTEVAGTFILSARQTGKTTDLNGFIDILKKFEPRERVVAVAPYKAQLELIKGADVSIHGKEDIRLSDHDVNTATDHLVVDEFMYLDRAVLDYLLSFSWRSVTMIGGMK